ncbi:MAG: hydrogen peroxide-inducible genes activator [Magnetococcales bacterium]|nr:hydrogen peroxide-inducible genes activator [Magnetococcales bacterium]
MNLRQLQYALTVARELSFSRAAQLCHVSQPSLSVAVKNLEEELGISLFERCPNEVRITPEGKAVLDQIGRTLTEIDKIHELAKTGLDPLIGHFRLGAILTVGPYLFPGLVPPLRDAAPRLRLLVEENYTSVLTSKLKSGELDAVIVALPYAEPGVEMIPLFDDPFVVAVPANHPWRGREDLTGEELAGENLLLLGKGNCFRDHVLEICPSCTMHTHEQGGEHNIIEGSSLETIRHMVATGVGITVLPLSSVKTLLCASSACPLQEQRLMIHLPFRPPVPSRRIVLAFRPSFPNPGVIRLLASIIRRFPPSGTRSILSDPHRMDVSTLLKESIIQTQPSSPE